MIDETPPEGLQPDEQAPSANEQPGPADIAAPAATEPAEAVTPGGYTYTVVEDEDAAPNAPSSPGTSRNMQPLLLAGAAAIVSALIAGVIVWFVASGGGASKDRINADVSNVVNAFSQAQGGASQRFEGSLAPGYPSDLPAYPGAKLLSSIAQVRGADASYLVIYDTGDNRAKVSAYFADKFSADPWQIDASQDGRDSALHQFSKINDEKIRGLVLAAESNGDNVTTIVVSLQITAGASALGTSTYDPGVPKTLPDGFPDTVPAYPGSVLVEAAYQTQPNGRAFTLSFVTKDDITKVLDYYRAQLQSSSLTVTDGDATQSTLENAAAIDFTDTAQTIGGQVTAGKLAEDGSYTRIDMQVQATKKTT